MRVAVWSCAQECGADGGLELADLAGEDGGPDAELAGCVLEAGLAGEGEEPPDALLGTGDHIRQRLDIAEDDRAAEQAISDDVLRGFLE